jgi:Enoyl-CoA hydratase/isomerase
VVLVPPERSADLPDRGILDFDATGANPAPTACYRRGVRRRAVPIHRGPPGNTDVTEPSALLEVADGLAHLRLNRPQVRNALHAEDVALLHELLDQVDFTARALVLSGEGKAFCSGRDLSDESLPLKTLSQSWPTPSTRSSAGSDTSSCRRSPPDTALALASASESRSPATSRSPPAAPGSDHRSLALAPFSTAAATIIWSIDSANIALWNSSIPADC